MLPDNAGYHATASAGGVQQLDGLTRFPAPLLPAFSAPVPGTTGAAVNIGQLTDVCGSICHATGAGGEPGTGSSRAAWARVLAGWPLEYPRTAAVQAAADCIRRRAVASA